MRFFCYSLLLILVCSCSNSKTKRTQLIDFIPEDSEIVLKTSNLENLKSALQNNGFVQTFSKTETYGTTEKQLENLSYLNPTGDILVCFSKENDSTQYTLISKYTSDIFSSDSLKNYSEETLKFKNKTIVKSELNGNTFYSTVIDSTFLLSSSKTIIDRSFEGNGRVSKLANFNDVVDVDETFSSLIKADSSLLKSFFTEESLSVEKLTDILALDVQMEQNDVYFNGIVKSLDSSYNILDIFKGTVSQENKMPWITPNNSDGFLSVTFDDFATFYSNLAQYWAKDSISNTTTLFDNITEIGVIYEDDERAIVLHSIDIIATQDALLGDQNTVETYRDISVFEFGQPEIFANTLTPFIDYTTASRYCLIDDFFVFSNSRELLQNIITNHQNKTTLGERENYKKLTEHLSSESSMMFVLRPHLLETVVAKNLGESKNLKLDGYSLSGLQFVNDSDFAHVHGAIQKKGKNAVQNSITEEFNVKLENDLLNAPQLVTNHVTKQKEIVVQDINNTLYLISNRGKILWKKRLNGPILGEVAQMDIYKNGRLQLVFATPNRVYLIDRKGRDVGPFPLKFNDNITQPLSLFDYDNNKKYRLLVTQGQNVLMYDTKGKIVKGFTFKSANAPIVSQPKHFRIGAKDYLVLKTRSKLYILDRTGKTRVTPKANTSFSNEPVFLYQNKFTTTAGNGKLFSVDTRGNTSKVDLNLSSDHYLETTSKTRVTLNDNKLGIKSKVQELDFGNYTRPKIFYINNKIYVSVTDLQAKKVLLFDSQGKMRPNFPVYGNSIIDLDNTDKDNALEFVVKGENNSILMYQIN
ncbi:PQQ-binding-like beta-propeller repeat protein [Hyunsoonleella sp. SJ7]|uniref:PQQ-binding-like beta-propeller repeat protein n=1 Tax=Hyunsoonleella aquatilis TaxID=2762758 RepID=A0A923KKH7_9FLAO|nr:PQQ-binding-like beta-propeller repeat protein [Hyunsoonleella aquatilis]MBC3757853.1 PQQ-binding-like beta-propeller repeat protein [Hyunsoonleella aquatilis]